MALSKKTKFVSGGILIAAAAIAAIVINRPEASASSQSTDDAYIRADITSVAPQVAGLVTHVLVEENETVKAGQLLARIDDRDYELAVRSAKATLASAQASADALKAQATVQQSVIHQASATLNADQANLKLARADFNRYSSLAADGSGTIQARQQAQARLRVQEAQHEKNRAIHQAETERLTILQADLQRAAAAVEQAKAAVAQAELNLSYTHIVAPISGVIGHKNIRVGNFAKIGEALVTVVPLADIYVEANFRETQLAKMRAGQPVTLTVDALPGQTFSGKVQSVGPASGVSYSAIAPHNATGNFTKIVQRLPVRIALDPDQENTSLLRVGMSVQPKVDVSRSNSAS
ncbi:HlyD family secretion protein [Bordetella genomosp. 4]|uniref:Efflux transporter periplasmic adaptor subunit n=1 Tax=Bordetella genomosp. 4 TaxID=463044 RepID=A0A261TWE1_9BORD|nr:HlyD family secretion protein [Bordetella genomosp. 4]OZI53996.1 efflux transporter periplasmic adaptor subunit [Bordetella genomosp. 4]